MANQGVRGFYQLTETIKEELLKDVNINTVTTGDITDVNLNKQDIFPLGHIIIESVIDEEQVLRFVLRNLPLDIVKVVRQCRHDRRACASAMACGVRLAARHKAAACARRNFRCADQPWQEQCIPACTKRLVFGEFLPYISPSLPWQNDHF